MEDAPDDVVFAIGERFLVEDSAVRNLVAVGNTCRSWRRAASRVLDLYQKWPAVPMAMMPPETQTGNDTLIRFAYIDWKRPPFAVKLPESPGWWSFECRYGFLLLQDHSSSQGKLLHPLTMEVRHLPSPTYIYEPFKKMTFPCHEEASIHRRPGQCCDGPTISRAVLSANPSTTEIFSLGVITYAGDAALWKNGGGRWDIICLGLQGRDRARDIVFHRVDGVFYVLGYRGLYRVDDSTGTGTVTVKMVNKNLPLNHVGKPPPDEYYMVDPLNAGQVLLIGRWGTHPWFIDHRYAYGTTGFQLWIVGKDDMCKRLDTLEGWCVFLGNNAPCAVRASSSPILVPDAIYFTDTAKAVNTCVLCITNSDELKTETALKFPDLTFGNGTVDLGEGTQFVSPGAAGLDAGIFNISTGQISRFPDGQLSRRSPMKWINLGSTFSK